MTEHREKELERRLAASASSTTTRALASQFSSKMRVELTTCMWTRSVHTPTPTTLLINTNRIMILIIITIMIVIILTLVRVAHQILSIGLERELLHCRGPNYNSSTCRMHFPTMMLLLFICIHEYS